MQSTAGCGQALGAVQWGVEDPAASRMVYGEYQAERFDVQWGVEDPAASRRMPFNGG